MKILLALDKFKGFFSAEDVSLALSKGIRETAPKATVLIKPVFDGGEGSAAALSQLMSMDTRTVSVDNISGQRINAHIHWLGQRRLALIESSEVLSSGLPWSRDDLLRSSSRPLGQLIVRALELRPKELWITAGGTLTCDGGWGLASCFGVETLNAAGTVLEPRVSNLGQIHEVLVRHHHDVMRRTEVSLLCDVNAPRSAPGGVTLRNFLKQKGARPGDEPEILEGIAALSRALNAAELFTFPDTAPFGGAAGGIALGLGAITANLKCVSGAETFLRLTALRAAIGEADVVVCGEGRLDETTLYGKSPYAVASLAHDLHVPVMGVFGEPAEPEYVSALHLSHSHSVTESESPKGTHSTDFNRRDWMKARQTRLVAIGRLIGKQAKALVSKRSKSA